MALNRNGSPEGSISKKIVTTKGDLITATANAIPSRLAAGTNEHRLVAASAETTGLKYVADTTNYAIAAKGDLLVGTAADTLAALTVGTNGHILTADSVEATGLKWAAPAASGMTFISRTTFSNVASQAIDDIFSSSYFSYLVIIEKIEAATTTDDLHMQLRYGSTTVTGALYEGNLLSTIRTSATTTNTNQNDTNQFTLSLDIGNSTYQSGFAINFYGVGNTSEVARWSGTGTSGANAYGANFFGGQVHDGRTYTGILLKSSTSNITGVVSVYGLAKA